jgi:hypothetical protein
MTCCNHDCNQGRTCPNRVDRAIGHALSFLAGIGFVGVCFAVGFLKVWK